MLFCGELPGCLQSGTIKRGEGLLITPSMTEGSAFDLRGSVEEIKSAWK